MQYSISTNNQLKRFLILQLFLITTIVHCFQTCSHRGVNIFKAGQMMPSSLCGKQENRESPLRRDSTILTDDAINSRLKSTCLQASRARSIPNPLSRRKYSVRGNQRRKKSSSKIKLFRIFEPVYLWTRQRRRYSIYVLECQNDKYYVGCTNNIKRRMKEHLSSRGGSSWTRIHRPIRLMKEYKRIPADYYLGKEAQVTAELMLTHGVNNVRGAMFAETRSYGIQDVRALTGFIGHYNEMSYKRLRSRLRKELLEEEARKAEQRKNDRCFCCGELGHHASECPHAWKKGVDPGFNRCFRCGELGHFAKDCPYK